MGLFYRTEPEFVGSIFTQEHMTLTPLMVIARSSTFDIGGGKVGVHWPPGQPTVLSIQPDGSVQTRPAVGGAYEEFWLIDDALYVQPIPGYVYAFRCPDLH